MNTPTAPGWGFTPDDDARWTAIGESFAQPIHAALERLQRAITQIIVDTVQRRPFKLANADNEFDYFYLSFQPCVEVNPEYCVDHHLHEPWYG